MNDYRAGMEQLLTVLIYAIVIFMASLVGAVIPYLMKLDDKRLHLMIAFSAGIFLGILFLMLLPEAIEETEDAGYDVMAALYAVLFGFLILFVVDFLIKQYSKSECECEECRDYHSHDITSMSVFIGLAIHACFDGLALASSFIAGEEIGFMVLIALCIHKIVDVFSLSSTFRMSNFKNKAIRYLLVFCMISPVAAVVSYMFLNGVDLSFAGLALSFSAGIFMFVTMCDIIPEAFHRKKLGVESIALLIVGLAMMMAVIYLTGIFSGGVSI
jgi:zinc transporter ZupT